MPKPKAVAKVIVELKGKRAVATLYPTPWRRKYRILVGGKTTKRTPESTVTGVFAELRRWTIKEIAP